MASVLESLTKKLEVLGEGRIYEEHLFEPEDIIATWEFEDPRIYKQIFNLDNKGGLAIERSLKSFLVEAKDGVCTFYYLLDSACLSIDFICKYQVKETIREVPLSLITYFRVLCGKKAPIEISFDEDFIYIVFEDSIVKDTTPKPKLKKGEKREKEVGKKYVLELPLSIHNTDSLDLAVVELFKEVWENDKEYDLEDTPLPIDLSNILFNKEPLQLYKYEVETSRGKLKCIASKGDDLLISVVVCPMEIAKSYKKDSEGVAYSLSSFEANELIPEDADVDYEEDMDKLSEITDIVDTFMLGDEVDE